MSAIYQIQRGLSDKFDNKIIDLLSKIFKTSDVKISSTHQDKFQNTDFVVNQFINISSRQRLYKYFELFPGDFTIRKESEYPKILKGFGDYLLYYFLDRDQQHIIKWSLINLDIFRKYESLIPRIEIRNEDQNDYKLLVFYVRNFPNELIVDSWEMSKEELDNLNKERRLKMLWTN